MKVLFNNNITIPENKVKTSGVNENKNNTPAGSSENISFQDVLHNKIYDKTPVQFSKHANMRLSSRNINLSSEQLQRVESGVQKAQKKGITDSLVLVDNIALVVNISSKTVITAIDNDSESVFTNINGAVIV